MKKGVIFQVLCASSDVLLILAVSECVSFEKKGVPVAQNMLLLLCDLNL